MFCGIVGSDRRQAFDVLGDPVNLSCRLMQLCSQTSTAFLCDELTTTVCAGKFMFAKLPTAYKMKGQSQKLAVYTVQRSEEYEGLGLDGLRRRIQAHTLTICGRYQERVCFLHIVGSPFARLFTFFL